MDGKRLLEIRDRLSRVPEGPWTLTPEIDCDDDVWRAAIAQAKTGSHPRPEIETDLGEVAMFLPSNTGPEAPEYCPRPEMVDFIVHSRADLDDLLAEVQRLQTENADLRGG